MYFPDINVFLFGIITLAITLDNVMNKLERVSARVHKNIDGTISS